MKEIVAEVISNETVAPGCRRMVLDAPEAACAEPGQFVHVLCGETGYPLLRRPFSVSDAAGRRITLLYRVAGTGTRLLSQKQKGDCVNLLGPLGKGLPLEQIRSRLVLLGGGLGVAPMVLAARRAAERGIETVAALGAATREALLAANELEQLCSAVFVTTEDGSSGRRGRVTDVLPGLLLAGDTVFACGSVPMLRVVKRLCSGAGIAAYLSLEERMACGIGACLGCAALVTQPDGAHAVKRVCADGPVFDAEEVLL